MKKDSRRVPSIRARLAWLVAACLLPAILLATLLLTNNYEQARHNVLSDSLATSRALLSAVDREFAAAEASLRTLSTSRLLRNNDLVDFHAQASEVLRLNSSINNIVLVDLTAQQLINTAAPYGQPLPKTNNPGQIERVFATGKSDISNIYMGALLKRHIASLAIPVYKDTTATFMLTGILLPERIQTILDDQRFAADRTALIFDGARKIVAATGNVEKLRGKVVNDGLANALKANDEGWLETVSLANKEVLATFTRSATSRWGVAILVPREAVDAQLRKSLWWLAGASTLLLAASLLAARFLGGRITRAIQQLIVPARDLALGKAVNIPALGIREADEVGRALMLTSTTLANTRSELDATHHALQSGAARMRGIVDSASDAFITVDDAQVILLFNPAAAAMFDCPPERAICRHLNLFIPDGLNGRLGSEVGDLRKTSVASGGANLSTGLRANGTPFPIEFSYSKAYEAGAAIHTLIIRDVTSRVQAHDALMRSNLDLQQFAYVASHDLKTPLRSISGFVELLERSYASKLDESALTLIRRTSAAAKRLEKLIDDLLSYARLTAEAKPFERVSCRAVVEDVIELLDSTIREAGATIEVGELPTIMGDRTQLIQLFLNLIGNGIKYCDTGKPVVHITATKREREWLVTVSDNGIGIEEKHLESIFVVFKRLHTHQAYAGTGIGLAVCRRVVEHHGGKLWASSVPGKGSTFSFTFPDIR